MYDEVYGATAVYLDAEDVAQSLGTEYNVQSVSAVFYCCTIAIILLI